MFRRVLCSKCELEHPCDPTQLYEAALGAALFAWALVLQRRAGKPGSVILPVAMALAVGRYLLGYLRADPDRGMIAGFTITQLVCLLAAPVCLLAYQQVRRSEA